MQSGEAKPGFKVRHEYHPEWGEGVITEVAGRGAYVWAEWANHQQQVWLPAQVLQKA
jgi:hypothetical protein